MSPTGFKPISARSGRHSGHTDWQPWKSCACLATAVVGVLGTLALVGLSARPLVTPAPRLSVDQEADHDKAMDEYLENMKGILRSRGFLKVKVPHNPGDAGLPSNMLDVGNLTEPEFPKMREFGEMPEELPELPELAEMPEFPKMEELPKMPQLPEMPDQDIETMVRQQHAMDFPEMPEFPEIPEPSEDLDLHFLGGSAALPIPIDANNETQSLVDKVKGDALKMMTSTGWKADLAPFRALTYCQQAVGSVVSTVKVQVGGGEIVQLTITRGEGAGAAPVLLSAVAVQAGERSCMGEPLVSRATKEIQKFADDVKAEVPEFLSRAGWPGVNIEPYKAISYCSRGTHLIVRLAMHKDRNLYDVDLQVWIHRQPSSLGDHMETLLSSAVMVKSSDKRCLAHWVPPAGKPVEMTN